MRALAEFPLQTYIDRSKKLWRVRNRIVDEVAGMSTMMAHRAQSVEREIAEILEKGEMRKIMGASTSRQQLREMVMKPIQTADKITTSILWIAKYREHLAATGNEGKARKSADTLIRTTQPMGGLVHLPALHRGGGLSGPRSAYPETHRTYRRNENL